MMGGKRGVMGGDRGVIGGGVAAAGVKTETVPQHLLLSGPQSLMDATDPLSA